MLDFLRYVRVRVWHARVSVLSLLAGLALLTLATPAQDVFLERASAWASIGFAVSLFLFWAVPVHYAARYAMRKVPAPFEARKNSRWSTAGIDRHLPRVLGLLTFAVAFVGLYLTERSLRNSINLPEVINRLHGLWMTAVAVAGAAVAFFAYFRFRRFVMTRIEERLRHPNSAVNATATVFLRELLTAVAITYAILSILIFGYTIFQPSMVTDFTGRADFLPILLGGWIPPLAVLTRYSDKVRWPVAISVIVLLTLATVLAERFHDVRTYRSTAWSEAQKSRAALQRNIALDDAVRGWTIANRCDDQPPASCPPMILVAAEGGGSRAAFYTAQFIGALLDATKPDAMLAQRGGTLPDFGLVVFAMSGVSGGALGVATARTALADAAARDSPSDLRGDPPCARSDPLWFGFEKNEDPKKQWRSCLQLLVSGDYLAPTMAGLAFHDALAFPLTFLSSEVFDRSVLLEQAIERHYNAIVSDDPASCGGGDDARGFCRPLGYLPPARPGHWLPLLFLNATDVRSGRQIIATDLNINARAPEMGDCTDLYPFSYSVFKLLASGRKQAEDTKPCPYSGLEQADDMRLSTAIALSARFPFLSPSGNLRDTAGDVAARAVDGGYFDNSGLETLNQLIPLLQAKGFRLLVLHLSTDIVVDDAIEGSPAAQISSVSIEPERGPWGRLFDAISSPLQTLNSTRSGHKERVIALARSLTQGDRRSQFFSPAFRREIDIREKAASRLFCEPGRLGVRLDELSLSWWLSPINQIAIDDQLCDRRSKVLLAEFLKAMETRPEYQEALPAPPADSLAP